MIKKILVANRGEIALRILKTARKMGVKTVAVYSEADRNALHVRFADEAVCLGPPPSSDSYLNVATIIDQAQKLGVDAIHPGYGFLSEQEHFAEAVTQAGITFIGPSPFSIKTMGSKLSAKQAVKDQDIPLVPGTDTAIENIEEAIAKAKEIGFPLLVKASAGGGGKGMRIVTSVEDLPGQMERAISEAKSAFGDGAVFIEKYIANPRHIEIQILADQHGQTLYLNERECSIQRRHQKVIEEAPATRMPAWLRRKMGEAAVRVAQSCDYVGAGTVEFLVDDDFNFYFLEMNTRLQVEHPVTELTTGIDLVEQQINIANGEKLAIQQSDISIKGHAIELRIYAEDPGQNFLPNVGALEVFHIKKADFVRLDSGYESGQDIPIYYDPLIAKLIVFGDTREQAISRLIETINDSEIKGVITTLEFGKFVAEHPSFIEGRYNTHFVQQFFSPEKLEANKPEDVLIAKIALKQYLDQLNKLRPIKHL